MSVEHLDTVILDHRITQYVTGNGIEVLAGLHRDFEKLTLPHFLNALVAEAC